VRNMGSYVEVPMAKMKKDKNMCFYPRYTILLFCWTCI
jgi:hypothetical protein